MVGKQPRNTSKGMQAVFHGEGTLLSDLTIPRSLSDRCAPRMKTQEVCIVERKTQKAILELLKCILTRHDVSRRKSVE